MLKRENRPARLLCTLVLGATASTAGADTFFVDGYGGFISGTAVGGSGVAYTNDADTATGGAFDVGADADGRNGMGVTVDLPWGTATGADGPYAGQSGYALSRVEDQPIEDNSLAVPVGRLTHFNDPISVGTALLSSDMEWTIALFANLTDAVNAEASGDANAVYSTTGTFTIYNWETNNAGYGPGGFRFFDGSAWVPNLATDRCPSDLPAGTPTSPNTGPGDPAATQIFISDGNPNASTECPDAHIYTPKSFPGAGFDYNGSSYLLQISGFYDSLGTLADTFWACEDQSCFGDIRLSLRNTTPTAVPAVTTWGLVLGILAMLGVGGVHRRRRS
ncbi:MAG: hypothetical protein RJQ10_05810 [Haliea sp.]|uniref:hypothetical protein n=1 Tax=Haliea sp. TaxID=1932666 RepID=UPI0032EFB09E